MATVTTYLDSDLRKMSDAERDAAALKLVQSSRRMPNGEVHELNQQLAAFEEVHRMTTAQMRERVRAGVFQETDVVCRWLMLADLRDALLQMQQPR